MNGIVIARGGEPALLTLSDRLRPPGIGFGVGWMHVYPPSIPADQLERAERIAVESVRALGLQGRDRVPAAHRGAGRPGRGRRGRGAHTRRSDGGSRAPRGRRRPRRDRAPPGARQRRRGRPRAPAVLAAARDPLLHGRSRASARPAESFRSAASTRYSPPRASSRRTPTSRWARRFGRCDATVTGEATSSRSETPPTTAVRRADDAAALLTVEVAA